MQRWEYWVAQCGYDEEETDTLLQRAGEAGWELASANLGQRSQRFYFKRPLPD